MTITEIPRSATEEVAMKLRDLARRLDAGEVKYAAVYAINGRDRVEEIIYDGLEESSLPVLLRRISSV